MLVIFRPSALSARTADSRPGPGPLMRTSRFLTPHSCAARPAASPPTGRGDRGPWRGDRRRLARALETGSARGRPRQRVTLTIRDGDDRVVERRVNVGDAFGDVLLDLLPRARSRGGRFLGG